MTEKEFEESAVRVREALAVVRAEAKKAMEELGIVDVVEGQYLLGATEPLLVWFYNIWKEIVE